VDDVAAHLLLPRPELAGNEDSVLRRSISLLAVGRLLDAALRRLGVQPAAIAGHSIGEWNAMMSAGLFSTASMDALIASVDPAAFELPGCLFAALGCGVETAQEAIAGVEGVVVSHDNCPHQSIICGEQNAIAAAMKRLDQRGVLSQVLNFRSGFHSPLLAPYLDRVSGVAKLEIGAASVPVWSATTTQPFPADEHAIRDLVIRHLLEPVRFRTLVENLYDSGIRAFIQVGVGSVTGFIDDTRRRGEPRRATGSSPNASHCGCAMGRGCTAATRSARRTELACDLCGRPPSGSDEKFASNPRGKLTSGRGGDGSVAGRRH
jgi:acyl transferase domain-containing protein